MSEAVAPATGQPCFPLRAGGRPFALKSAILVALLAPALLVFQPLLPQVLQWLMIYGRLILAPLLVALLLPRTQVWPALLVLVALVLVTGQDAMTARGNDFALLFCALLGSVVMFRFGAWSAGAREWSGVWRALVFGVSLANALTVLTFMAVVQGLIDGATLLEAINKADPSEQGLTRFSLGNAIETPFMLSALLLAGVVGAGEQRRGNLPAVALNLTTAVMSQSRLVMLMAFLMFGREFLRSGFRSRVLTVALLLAGAAWSWDLVQGLADSILARLGGNDAGSTDDRQFLFSHLMSAISPLQMLVGDGLTAGAEFLRRSTGEYRSVEAVALQLPFELGLIGTLLVVIALLGHPGYAPPNWRRPSTIVAIMWIQCLFFLPINNLMPVTALALGALSVYPGRTHQQRAPARIAQGLAC